MKNIALIRKMYDNRFCSNLSEHILIIFGFACFICYLLLKIVFDSEWADVSMSFVIACCFTLAFFFAGKMSDGYAIYEDGLFFKYRFKDNKLLYKDIKCIIISNWQRGMSKAPEVTVIGGNMDKIRQYFSLPKSHVLTGDVIRYFLGAEIGCYHPGNIWEILKKGSSTIYNYGFVWNKREMYKILEGFSGDYYVAKSVIEKFHEEFNNILEKYSISNERIHIINDLPDKT